jgi:hypothetical protein
MFVSSLNPQKIINYSSLTDVHLIWPSPEARSTCRSMNIQISASPDIKHNQACRLLTKEPASHKLTHQH